MSGRNFEKLKARELGRQSYVESAIDRDIAMGNLPVRRTPKAQLRAETAALVERFPGKITKLPAGSAIRENDKALRKKVLPACIPPSPRSRSAEG
jgi:hypothetical protein